MIVQSEKVAAILLETGAVRLQPSAPFTWASGWRSPIYCDNRITLSHPHARGEIADMLAEAIRKHEHLGRAQGVAGVATAGIPQGVLAAERLGLPFLYVRSAPKDHGRGNQIEGQLAAGQHIAVVEDLVSTGGSSLAAVQALKAAGAEVVGLACVFSYGFAQAQDAFHAGGVELVALCQYDDLIALAGAKGMFSEDEMNLLSAWRKDPSSWGR